MFIRYLGYQKSWIFLFVTLLGFADALIWLDRGIAVNLSSIIYLNALFLLILIVFIIWRYKTETRFTAALVDLATRDEAVDGDWVETLSRPERFPDEVAYEALRAADRRCRRMLSENRESQLIENDFMASWIHEVKTPLTAMKLTLDAHRSDPAIRKIEVEWLRLQLLIDRQLYMTRLPSLDADYVAEPASLRRLAAAEVRDLGSWCIEKNIAVEFAGDDAEVIIDRKWCRFILRQLLTNAIKYSPEGGTIAIVIGTSAGGSGNATLDICDEGPGIPAHDLPRIFDKGFTGGNGRIHNVATGLGLYLAQTAAAKIGIALAAQPGLSRGTKMRVIFAAKNEFESIRKGMLP